MIKILFVCYGNICRSPMAEFILKDIVRKQNMADRFYIASAATSTEEIWNGKGNPVYPPARKELAKHGISCEGKYAVQLCRKDYEAYDFLIGMDHANIRNMIRILGKDTENKVKLLMNYTGCDREVADPWYTGNFEKTYQDILTGCEAFFHYLKENGFLEK